MTTQTVFISLKDDVSLQNVMTACRRFGKCCGIKDDKYYITYNDHRDARDLLEKREYWMGGELCRVHKSTKMVYACAKCEESTFNTNLCDRCTSEESVSKFEDETESTEDVCDCGDCERIKMEASIEEVKSKTKKDKVNKTEKHTEPKPKVLKDEPKTSMVDRLVKLRSDGRKRYDQYIIEITDALYKEVEISALRNHIELYFTQNYDPSMDESIIDHFKKEGLIVRIDDDQVMHVDLSQLDTK